MKIVTLLITLFIGACSADQAKNTQDDESFILKNVNIIDVEHQQIRPAKSIVIKKGKIHTISDNTLTSLFPHLTVIEGNNGYVTAGLIDMHVHIYEAAAYILTLSHGVTHV